MEERRVNYREYIHSTAWREKCRQAFARAGHRCQLCASTKELTVHHNSYANLGNEKPEDLCVLCWPCHKRHHAPTEKITAHDVDAAMSRGGRRVLQGLDLNEQAVTLTKSERERRAKVARQWIAGNAREQRRRRKGW